MKNILTNRACHKAARLIAANIRHAERLPLVPLDDGQFVHDRIVAANESLFTEAYFSEPLTTYAVGYRDPNNIEASVEFFAPGVEVPRRFEYAAAVNAEEFYSETEDDLRAIGGDFKKVEGSSNMVNEKTENRGLKICVDLDQVSNLTTWREQKTAKLLRRLLRNKLRRAIALLSAAATNTAKTWDVSSGKDPDQDVLSELVTGRTASGISATRVGYGDTAWSKRILSHRAQSTAGGFASAGLSAQEVAAFLGVDQVFVSKERYQSAAATKTEIVANLVLMFNAMTGADQEDPSNIKGFWTPCEGGQRFRVYERQLSAKLYEIVVEHYEKLKITSTLGIRQFTIS
jgi:hypothetical protein